MKKNIAQIILLFILFPFITLAQLSDIQQNKIDSLFVEWNQPNHPGGVIGIQKGDKIIYQKAYGLASLDYLVPNNVGTLFNIASVSKQFTSVGILLLESEGKLSIDDDIHKYLPEIPDFGYKITIRHLMHHTSGLRSFHTLLEVAGWRDDDARSNADILRLMKRQKDLNFPPGDQYLYCNTGYMLMSDIIERITGEKFSLWMKKNVFESLGMQQTYVEGDYSNIVPGNSTSYFGSQKDGFKRSIDYWSYVGSGNIHTSVGDILIWLRNFSSPKEGWKPIFERLQTCDTLNNGKLNNYALGVVVDDYYGFIRISHGGSIGGFRSFIGAFPKEELSIVVLTNFSSSGITGKVNKIVDELLNIKKEDLKNKDTESEILSEEKSFNLNSNQLNEFAGLYYSKELETFYTFSVVNNQLWGHHSRHGDFKIGVIDTNNMKAEIDALEKIEVFRNKKGVIIGLFISNSRAKKLWFEKAVIKSNSTNKLIQQ